MTNNSSQTIVSRRDCLKAGSMGLGSLMVSGFVPGRSDAGLLAPKQPHFTPKAKRVIFLFINGGPSQFESFDYKPDLAARSGKKGIGKGKLLGPLWKFAQHGESGMWVSEAFPHLAKQTDRLCMLNGMQTSSRAHPIAIPMLHTGEFQFVRPSFGSWVLYGLGTENQDLPGFFTVKPTRTFGGPANYGSAFLPSTFQATRLGWDGQAIKSASIRNLTPNHGLTPNAARGTLELAQPMNQRLLGQTEDVRGVIDSLELSERMQQAVPNVLDLGRETKETLDMYGVDAGATDDFGRQCLLARRLVESGVRFVEVSNSGWDHHSGLDKFNTKAEQIDKPIAALLTDLARRGLLEDTLVLWTGEFGRTPDTQVLDGKETIGRDHNAEGYTAWLAGGGVHAGLTHGATDELGYKAVEGVVHLHDLHATMLHLLGLDHTKLVYRYGGRDFRLTNIHGNVIHDIIA
ncbi:MAG: sulfatase [Planctomycetaceae bacterium]|nr:sulfatase [Planctomycetaceae bacterium]